MDEAKKSQIFKLSIIASLCIITPLIPTMFKSTYLYFIFNLLIVALAVEAGLISFFSKSFEHSKSHSNTTVSYLQTIVSDSNIVSENKDINKPKVVEKCSLVKLSKVRKSPSTPSIFFIGNGENEPELVIEEDKIKEDEVISGEELFTKAEMFIGNFYKQLKMQREDSWNKIHGFIRKPFDHLK